MAKAIDRTKKHNKGKERMKLKPVLSAFISGIAISIKRLLTYNRATKAINREAYDKSIEEEISLLEEMYLNPPFSRLLDWGFWCDIQSERYEQKRANAIMTDTERSIAKLYLIWKEDENRKPR